MIQRLGLVAGREVCDPADAGVNGGTAQGFRVDLLGVTARTTFGPATNM